MKKKAANLVAFFFNFSTNKSLITPNNSFVKK